MICEEMFFVCGDHEEAKRYTIVNAVETCCSKPSHFYGHNMIRAYVAEPH